MSLSSKMFATGEAFREASLALRYYGLTGEPRYESSLETYISTKNYEVLTKNKERKLWKRLCPRYVTGSL